VLDEHLGGSPHDVKRVTGALGDVEQAVVAFREVKSCRRPARSLTIFSVWRCYLRPALRLSRRGQGPVFENTRR
jgi:hypothetical protein